MITRFLLALSLTAVITATAETPASATLQVRADQPGPVVDPAVYGHFAEHLGGCIYDGFWVGEDSAIPNTRGIRNDVVQALRAIRAPVLRWPGGCFADDYHWRDGIGPRNQRPKRTNRFWGKVTESNQFGTHEFMDLCEQVGCDAYIAGNLGSGSPLEMQQWLEYLTADGDSELADLRRANGRQKPWKVAYFGVGNENWGCGGNMTPEYYSDEYLRFRTYLSSYSGRTRFVACGPGGVNPAWMNTVASRTRGHTDAISVHSYVMSGPWKDKGHAVDFTTDEWFRLMANTLDVDQVLSDYGAILDQHDPDKRIAMFVDEWGTWWNPTEGSNPGFLVQQNTLRDALCASLFFHLFHRHADRVRMGNIAQTVNVLQAMAFTKGPDMVLTPTYHLFGLYQVHQGGKVLPVKLDAPSRPLGDKQVPIASATATRAADGTVHLGLTNLDPERPLAVTVSLEGMKAKSLTGRVLTAPAMNTHNSFDQPDAVKPAPFKAAKLGAGGTLSVDLPPRSVVVLALK